jgi:hypothetical protein
MTASIVLTEKDREAAQTMYAYGIPQEQIARILRCDHETLMNRLGKQMEDYKVKANARVASTLYQMAISGDSPVSTFFWLKTRAGWRETDRLEIESRNVSIQVTTPQDPRQLAEAVRILIEAGALRLEDVTPRSLNGSAGMPSLSN